MIRLAIRVAREQAELVLAELAELAPAGLEERDVDALTVEYAIYGAPGELPPLPDLKAAAGGALVDVSTTELADDWDVRWRTWHPAVVVEAGGRTLRVRPPWEEPQPGTIDVAIEPAQAFGTGAHETTRLSLALLMELRARKVSGTFLALSSISSASDSRVVSCAPVPNACAGSIATSIVPGCGSSHGGRTRSVRPPASTTTAGCQVRQRTSQSSASSVVETSTSAPPAAARRSGSDGSSPGAP